MTNPTNSASHPKGEKGWKPQSKALKQLDWAAANLHRMGNDRRSPGTVEGHFVATLALVLGSAQPAAHLPMLRKEFESLVESLEDA